MKVKEIQYIDPNLFTPKDAWDALSMREKAEMMRVAVRNGITNLQEIRQEYNEFAEGGDTENDDYYATMEKVAEENYKNWGFNNPDEALVHALNDYTYDYRGYYQKYPQSRANADTHWTDEFKTVYHPTFSNESRYSGQKSIYNPLGLPGGFWVGETFVPRAWQVVEANKFTEGGGIHIKPENRGKFTALKERTGHSASWFKEHGTPAQKKMATFALNARKWKHGDGGNLYGGESEDTQQMQIGREYWQQQTSQPTLEQALAEFNRQKEIERQQKAAALREQIAAKGRAIAEQRLRDSQVEPNDNAWVDYSFTVKKPKNPHLHDSAVEGAKAHAAWEKEHPKLTAWGNVLGAAPFAVAAYPLASTIGSGVAAIGDAAAATTTGQGLTNFLAPVATSTLAGVPAMEWANAGLTSMFGAHGVKTAIDEGGISPMTALEIAPMLQVAKPMNGWRRVFTENTPAAEWAETTKPTFKSELDWSPESWFGTRATGVYDAEDVAALQSHLPEYLEIERTAKANGTWLKMSDGSTWQGDPRSWVQMQSKAYNAYTGNSPFKYQPFSHTTDSKFDTFNYSHFGETDEGFYGRGFYTHPAEPINGKLIGRNTYGDENYLLTTNVQHPFDLDNPDFEYAGLFNKESPIIDPIHPGLSPSPQCT